VSIFVTSLVWKFSKADGSTLLTALAIADFADDDGRAFPAVATLAKKARISERSVQYAVDKLRALGELTVSLGTGPKGCNTYFVGVQALRGAIFAGVQNATQGGATHCTQTITEPSLKKKHESAGVSFDFDGGLFVGLSSDQIGRWQEAFPAIDVVAQVKRAAVWLAANPKNRKSDYVRFLANWLNRAQDRAPTAGSSTYGANPNERTTPHQQRSRFAADLAGRPANRGHVIDITP
jgi:hypothetical protein